MHAPGPSFEDRVRDAGRIVYAVAHSVLRDPAEAEDVAQEVFLMAYRKLDQLRDPGQFRAWVARMSWRQALNRKRGWRRRLARDFRWSAARPAAAAPEETLTLQHEVERMPEHLREVLVLAAIEGLEAREVSAILEIPEGTVRSRLHAARKHLLEVWK